MHIVNAQTKVTSEGKINPEFMTLFGVLMVITGPENPHLSMPDAIEMWEYGLDTMYFTNGAFKQAVDMWVKRDGDGYAGLTFEEFLAKCGVPLSDLEAAQIATKASTIVVASKSTSASNVDG